MYIGSSFFFRYTKTGQRVFPKWNKRINDSEFSATLTTKEIKKDADGVYAEIPLFRNIYLDYEASGEMSKYLSKVEIREHPFSQLIKTKGKLYRPRSEEGTLLSPKELKRKIKIWKEKGIPYNMRPIYKNETNISLWRARFYFTEVPQDGEIEIFWT